MRIRPLINSFTFLPSFSCLSSSLFFTFFLPISYSFNCFFFLSFFFPFFSFLRQLVGSDSVPFLSLLFFPPQKIILEGNHKSLKPAFLPPSPPSPPPPPPPLPPPPLTRFLYTPFVGSGKSMLISGE